MFGTFWGLPKNSSAPATATHLLATKGDVTQTEEGRDGNSCTYWARKHCGVDAHTAHGLAGAHVAPVKHVSSSSPSGSVRVDQNAPKVGMRPRVGILSSAPSRRAIASVHRGRTCRDFNGRENARRGDLRGDLTLDLQRIVLESAEVATYSSNK
jgi:hypothetical protein